MWRDSAQGATAWTIDVAFTDGAAGIRATSAGERLRIGEIDPRCVSNTNEPPKLTPLQAAAHTWIPDAATWAAIQKHSTEHPATFTITGYQDQELTHAVSRGAVVMKTSKDPVGAPIFYRDVPLMPSETEKGVIKPLAARSIPLIAWRLRNIAEPQSHLLLTGMHSCANCHSFSLDGKTLGMDLDGPSNNKGLYVLASIKPQMALRNQDVISWSALQDNSPSPSRVGFMSQVSPNGRYVLTMLRAQETNLTSMAQSPYFVVNFKDYHFLQVFYPTRGVVAFYDRATGKKQLLPGADDPHYVQTDGVWSPDGKFVVFARAVAKDPYYPGQKQPLRANDPDETQIQFNLYRIPFNDGKGGVATPLAGASHNGMSNNFPKVSPDGRWIVFVKCRNGQLMRPDSQLYIVPSEGGVARRMRCNTSLMNSWHSFSPNGHWLVFSSKSRSPYTQMYLTHLDPDGTDSPAILIDNSTAANRAVNIPEFVNIPADGMMHIDAPAAEEFRLFDVALDLTNKGKLDEAIAEWKKVLELDPDEAKAHKNLANTLRKKGDLDGAIAEYRQTIRLDPGDTAAHINLGALLGQKGDLDGEIAEERQAVKLSPESVEAHVDLGLALGSKGDWDGMIAEERIAARLDPSLAEPHYNLGEAMRQKGDLDGEIAEYREAARLNPNVSEVHTRLGIALGQKGDVEGEIAEFREAVRLSPNNEVAHCALGTALDDKGDLDGAIAEYREALRLNPRYASAHYDLGAAMEKKSDPEKALEEYRAATTLDPNEPTFKQNYERLLHQMNP